MSKQRGRLLVGLLTGGVVLALLVGIVALVVFRGADPTTARFAPNPLRPTGPDLYSETPGCEDFSDEVDDEIDEELGQPRRHEEAPELAEDGSYCRWFDPFRGPVALNVDVTRYARHEDVSGSARAQGALAASADLTTAERVDGPWDFAVINERCWLLARDSNLLLAVGLRSLENLEAPCDEERLLRYARDWAEQNFTE